MSCGYRVVLSATTQLGAWMASHRHHHHRAVSQLHRLPVVFPAPAPRAFLHRRLHRVSRLHQRHRDHQRGTSSTAPPGPSSSTAAGLPYHLHRRLRRASDTQLQPTAWSIPAPPAPRHPDHQTCSRFACFRRGIAAVLRIVLPVAALAY